MKYLAALKNENPLNVESKESKNPHHDVLQKVQKPLFTVFAVEQVGTFQKKKEQEKDDNETIRAKGYGCRCGHNSYQQVEDFVMCEAPGEWKHLHTITTLWRCEGCGSVYQIIGGSKGPTYIQ